eukprot:TRINITY_DN12641_c0_g1_i1.p1 TRINITY_DN12641_c0_g1~~TRINITY_DN12641_c0_g1_i1.p1  ORF type:complete len:146 (-),score=18.06 TRINITY_DN12641_c0_g1_i1:14-451(-)
MPGKRPRQRQSAHKKNSSKQLTKRSYESDQKDTSCLSPEEMDRCDQKVRSFLGEVLVQYAKYLGHRPNHDITLDSLSDLLFPSGEIVAEHRYDTINRSELSSLIESALSTEMRSHEDDDGLLPLDFNPDELFLYYGAPSSEESST